MPQLRPIDVPHARLSRGVFSYASKSFSRTRQPPFWFPVTAESVRSSAVRKLIGALLRDASVSKRLSTSIDRVRRKRQRLPSSLLIENVRRSTPQLRLGIRPPRHFRLKLTTTRPGGFPPNC